MGQHAPTVVEEFEEEELNERTEGSGAERERQRQKREAYEDWGGGGEEDRSVLAVL